MSRVAWLLDLVFPAARAHPGHDAAEPHLHELWEVALLLAIVAALLVIYRVRRHRSHRQGKLRTR